MQSLNQITQRGRPTKGTVDQGTEQGIAIDGWPPPLAAKVVRHAVRAEADEQTNVDRLGERADARHERVWAVPSSPLGFVKVAFSNGVSPRQKGEVWIKQNIFLASRYLLPGSTTSLCTI